MSFRKKISLGVISAVCAFAFVACGDSKSTPKCGDKDVQEKLREDFLKHGLNDSDFKNVDRKDLEKFAKSMKFQNIITEATDEARKKVTCKANVKFDADTFKDLIYLIGGQTELQDVIELKSGERLTEKNIEEIFVRTAEKNKINDSMTKAQKEEIRKEAKEIAKKTKEELSKHLEEGLKHLEEEELEYTAQRTDDGKLIVKELKDHDE